MQGSSQRMSAKEEGVRQVLGKPRRCAREPESNSNRGTKILEGTVLSEGFD